MIVDQPVGVSGTRAYAVGRVGGRGKWKGSALSIQPRSSFNVLRVDLDGLQISLVVPVPELLKSSGLHARDLIALGVQDSYDSESWNKKTVMDSAPFVPHPVILARKGVSDAHSLSDVFRFCLNVTGGLVATGWLSSDFLLFSQAASDRCRS